MLNVMGWAKVAPGVVLQLDVLQPPLWQPQLDRVRVTVVSGWVERASEILFPNSM